VRIGKTDARMAELACDGLLGLGAKVLGVVMNAVPGAAGREVSYFDLAGALAPSQRTSLVRTMMREDMAGDASGRRSPRA